MRENKLTWRQMLALLIMYEADRQVLTHSQLAVRNEVNGGSIECAVNTLLRRKLITEETYTDGGVFGYRYRLTSDGHVLGMYVTSAVTGALKTETTE